MAENKDEQIGIHKGSLSTLAKERQELQRLISITEQLMHMHIAELKKLGIDLEKEAKERAKEKTEDKTIETRESIKESTKKSKDKSSSSSSIEGRF